jgi:myo-inositol 2-dehydrogenase / D-chiro-inositol 1-dehydrogenase
MPFQNEQPLIASCSRRQFLQKTAMAGAVAYGATSLVQNVHAAGSDVIKIGLIGCGGRGSGAAANAMNAGKDVHLVAMADLFDDHLQDSRERLKKMYPEQAFIKDDHCFAGFDAYDKLIHSDIDVVLIAAASHFHPQFLTAAIAAGKHVFCEKPHGLDVPGLKISMAAAEEAKKKNLCLVSGLCWRYDPGVREAMKRIQDGAIGEIIAIQETYVGTPYLCRDRKPGWSELEFQFQDWYHFNWLSGDQTAQQLIHSTDKASWVMGDVPPVKAWGMGGRQVTLEPKYGDQFDHHALVYEYENGVRVFAFTRDMLGCFNETSDVVFGTKGKAVLPHKPHIEGENAWTYQGPTPSMYDVEHQELFDAIRTGKIINNSNYMHTSSMLAILAQMVCYTGQEITWEDAMKSELSFALPHYAWDAEPPVKPDANGLYPTAMPGITKFR